MATHYITKKEERYLVTYRESEDLIFQRQTCELKVEKEGPSCGHDILRRGDEATIVRDILVGDAMAVNKARYDALEKSHLKLEYDFSSARAEFKRCVEDKDNTIKNLEFVIKELEKDVQLSRKKYADATKYNDELFKDCAHWKQMYEEVYKVYNHEVDIQHENEELMKERNDLKYNIDIQRSEIARLNEVNCEVRKQRDKYKKELAEEKLVRKTLEETIRRNAKTIDAQAIELDGGAKAIMKLNNEIEIKERRLEQQRKTILEHCDRIEILTEENRELKRVKNEILKTGHNIGDVLTIDNLKKELDEEKLFKDAIKNRCEQLELENKKLDEIVENQADTIRELEEKNDLQEQTIHKLETVISKKSNRIGLLQDQNDKLQKRNEGLCKRLDELASKTYCSEDYVNTLKTELSANKLLEEGLECKIKDLEFENASLKKKQAESIKKIEELETRVKDFGERNMNLIITKNKLTSTIEGLEDEIKRLQNEPGRWPNEKLLMCKEIEDLKMKLKNAQESNGKIWNMYAEQLAKNKERQYDFNTMERIRLVSENFELRRKVEEDKKKIDDLSRKCEAFEKAEPTYVQISGLRAGSMVLKLMGENHKLRKERDNALEALSERDYALTEARAELMKRRPCCGCPFKS